MLKKIVGSLLGLALAGFGVALAGGFLDPAELDADGGSRRSRALKHTIGWLCDTFGATAAGGILIALGLIVLLIALRSGGKPAAAAKK